MQLAHLPTADQRSAEILAAVRMAFVEKGFDGASMQDLARAAGISVGNFYRYFPSKSAIIQALIAADVAMINYDFAEVIASTTPMASLRAMISQRIDDQCDADTGALWAEIEAAARRSPEIGHAACRVEEDVLSCLNRVFAAETGLSPATCAARFAAPALFIMMLFKAATSIDRTPAATRTDLKAHILRAIDQTLADIGHSARKA